MPGEGVVRVVLVPKQPFASDHIGTGWSRHKALGAISDESIVLIGHRSTLVGIDEGAVIVCWNRRGSCGGEIEAIHWTQATGLGPCHRREGGGGADCTGGA